MQVVTNLEYGSNRVYGSTTVLYPQARGRRSGRTPDSSSHTTVCLNASQLHDCRARFERIMDLQEEVARLRKESILGGRKPLLAK
jgi:hypothetical protein